MRWLLDSALWCAWLWQPPFWGGLNQRRMSQISKNMCKLIQKRSLKVQSLLAPRFIRLCPASCPQCSVVTSSAGLSWVSVAEPGPCPAHSGHNVHSVTVVLNRAYCSYTHQEIYKYKIQILFYYWIFEVLLSKISQLFYVLERINCCIAQFHLASVLNGSSTVLAFTWPLVILTIREFNFKMKRWTTVAKWIKYLYTD